ncbi:adenosine receptor A2b-like [Actinia tenebrosa]|uniref:Adenosine receptor A2b-like n=1 Tax=Actinia tenebrosa TaxID=6105 RepID=A0A6P8HQN3_ACTTE|nr:adenosine receptor A2b-like [Actinia tenebrosa]XP_031558693.1 adenosine receptor A2b-like [Actinia tenebrosa]XP_031558694.1 adenosine receptor A2b-like [Actinia tenebrosa]
MDHNSTSNYENYKAPTREVVILVFLNSLGCILGTPANALVIVVIFSMRCLRTSRNYILASLSGSDLITCVVWQPLLIDSVLNGLRVNFLVLFCTFFASLSSLNNLICLTMERFIAVHFPFRYLNSLTRRLVVFICFLAYSIAFLLASLIATKHLPYEVIYVYILILTLLMMLFYANIYCTAMKQVRKIQAMQKTPTDVENSSKVIKAKYTTTSVAIVVALFVLSWLPYLLLPAIPKQHFSQAFPWVNTCAILQSNINPFLYFWKFASFRRESRRCLQKLQNSMGIL